MDIVGEASRPRMNAAPPPPKASRRLDRANQAGRRLPSPKKKHLATVTPRTRPASVGQASEVPHPPPVKRPSGSGGRKQPVRPVPSSTGSSAVIPRCALRSTVASNPNAVCRSGRQLPIPQSKRRLPSQPVALHSTGRSESLSHQNPIVASNVVSKPISLGVDTEATQDSYLGPFPLKVWQVVGQHLEVRDLVALSASSKILRTVARNLGHPRCGPALYPLDSTKVSLQEFAAVVNMWANLRFVYTCRDTTEGRVWSESDQAHIKSSMLACAAGANSVSLIECDDVRDISMLENIGELTLTRCNGLREVVPPRSLKMMTLEWCLNISDISTLENVAKLTLDRCPKVSDLSGLVGSRLRSLTVRKCRNVRDVAPLAKSSIETLHLEQLHNIEVVSSLSGMVSLTIIDCPGIKEVVALDTVLNLVLRRCRGIRDLASLGGRPGLIVEECGLQAGGSKTSLFDGGSPRRSVSPDRPGSVSTSTTPLSNVDDDDDELDPGHWLTRSKRQQALRAREAAIELELEAEDRLMMASIEIEEAQERFLEKAEDKVRFDEIHFKARERRRLAAAERVALLAQARSDTEAAASRELAAREQNFSAAEAERLARKSRVAAMLSKIKMVT